MNEEIDRIEFEKQAEWFRKCHEKEVERQHQRRKERRECAFQILSDVCSILSEETFGHLDETYKYFHIISEICSNIIDKHVSQ